MREDMFISHSYQLPKCELPEIPSQHSTAENSGRSPHFWKLQNGNTN